MMCEFDRIEIQVRGKILKIAHIDAEHATFLKDPVSVIARLKGSEAPPDIFTFLQGPPDTEPRFDYPRVWDNLAVLPVTSHKEWWEKQIGSVPRKKVRKAQRAGVEVREVAFDDDFIDALCVIYNESAIRQGRRFEHYGMTREKARAYAGTFLERSVFVGAFWGGQLIGFVKFVLGLDGQHACTFHVISLLKHRDKSPTNALISQAVESCAARGVNFLIYDHFAYGSKLADGLTEFKVANGFRRMDLPRYYVPMNRRGVVAMRLGLHLPWNERLPERVLTPLRALRTRWVAGRFGGTISK